MKARRGLSTVVGMVFAIIALTSTVAYVSYSMNTLSQYNNAVLTTNQGLSAAGKESFKIASVTLPNSKLNITLSNTGAVPITFTNIWVQNTSTTNWIHSYVPTNSFVSPGATLTNLGQNIPTSINPSKSYNIKLVTSRGNNQAFTVNSASAAPLNIQMMFLPPTVSSGFKSELMMVVINNGTGTLTNISPSTLPNPTYGASNTGNIQCNAGSVNPPTYNTLAPGNAAFFTWDITTSGGNPGDTCTYNLTQPLKNGYSQNVSPPTPLTLIAVSLSSTTYAQNAGLLTITYTSFQWLQNSTWNSSWLIPGGKQTAFSVAITNNNMSNKNVSLYLSKQSQLAVWDSKSSAAAHQFYITEVVQPGQNSFTISTPYTCNGNPKDDYCVNIAPGGTTILYFAQANPGNDNSQIKMIGSGDDGIAFIILFGKFSTSQSNSGTQYGQNLPFIGILAQ